MDESEGNHSWLQSSQKGQEPPSNSWFDSLPILEGTRTHRVRWLLKLQESLSPSLLMLRLVRLAGGRLVGREGLFSHHLRFGLFENKEFEKCHY